jgi:flavorubredoxin
VVTHGRLNYTCSVGLFTNERSPLDEPLRAAPDIDVLTTYFTIPGYGMVPINAFLLKATEPLLVDTGFPLESDEFMDALRSVIDPQALKWIWLTHTDQDHIGSLHRILEEAPEARIITTFLSVGKMSLVAPLPMDRVYLLNPGQRISVGDRTLTAVKPPSFDAPETTGFYDDKSGALFSSDCFGALMTAPARDAADIPQADLKEGQTLWATIDAPWLHTVDKNTFAAALSSVRQMSPKMILSSHLPVARGMTDQLLTTLASVPGAEPFMGPDQAALQEMLAQMTQVPS